MMVNRMRSFIRSLAPFCRGFLLVVVPLLILIPGAEAKKKVVADYDQSGSVLSYNHDGQIYRVATDRLIFTLTCDKVK